MRGLYIHIPFCIKKCKYCDFVSFSGCEKRFGEYIDALCNEMAEYKGEKIDTVFIGGGTPTLLAENETAELLLHIRNNFELSADTEFSVEANPKTLTPQKLSALKEGGVNRISIGIQSFNDDELLNIGRRHNAAEAEEAFYAARNAGFDNINIDIMFSLPGQTGKSFLKTLRTVIGLNPEHISCYSLILEEGTPLYDEAQKGILQLPNEEEDRENYELARRVLREAGYIQYEISNFAKTGFECRHNLKYWDCDEYIGLGLAAHSYYRGRRFFNTENLGDYLKGKYRTDSGEQLTRADKISEFMIMGLRKTAGIDKREFSRRFGCDVKDVFGEQISRFIGGGFMAEDSDNLRLTEAGVNVSNSILCEFV